MSKENKNQKKQDLRASDSVVNQKNNKQSSATNSTQEQKKRDGNGM